jgi:hypothetical protein
MWPELRVWVRSFGRTLRDTDNIDLPEDVWKMVLDIFVLGKGTTDSPARMTGGNRLLRGRDAIAHFFAQVPQSVLVYAVMQKTSRLQALTFASLAAGCGLEARAGSWEQGGRALRCLVFTRRSWKGGPYGKNAN